MDADNGTTTDGADGSESETGGTGATGAVTSRGRRNVEITRVAENRYRVVGASGGELEFGRGEGLLTPVELLLAALAGCSAIDVDTVTSRRSEPEEFTVRADAELIDEEGATRLEDVSLDFALTYPDDPAGRTAAGMVERLVALSHDRYCTVSRTIEHATLVRIGVQEGARDADG